MSGLIVLPNWLRMVEWWEFKIVPAVAMGLAACLYGSISPVAVWPAFALLLACLLPGAIYVSIINDLSDLDDDRRAAKFNRLEGRSLGWPLVTAAACVAAGGVFMIQWRDQPALAGCYLVGWLAFSAYSLPPARLKNRGLPGAMADAIGAHVVPGLVAVLLVARYGYVALDPAFLAGIAVWTFCFGLRSLLWHQIADHVADQMSGSRTFVVRFGAVRTMDLTRYVLFPLEVAAFLAVMFLSGMLASAFGAAAFAFYLWFVVRRIDRFEMTYTLVKPRARSIILMHEYYDAFLPVALILAASVIDPRALAMLAVYVCLFPMRLSRTVRDFRKTFDPQYESARARNRL